METRIDRLAYILKHGELRFITYSQYLLMIKEKPEPHIRAHCDQGKPLYVYIYNASLAIHSKRNHMLCLYHEQRLSSFALKVYNEIQLIKDELAEKEIQKEVQMLEA